MADTQDVPRVIICKDCGREVPEGNMTIHQLRACVARARRPGDEDDNNETQPMDVDEHRSSIELSGPVSAVDVAVDIAANTLEDDDDDHNNEDHDDQSEVQVMEGTALKSCPSSPSRPTRPRTEDEALLATPQRGMRRRRRRLGPEAVSGADNMPKIVDLVSEDNPIQHQPSGPAENQWACPQCTLYNDKSGHRCEACQFPNPERPLDPTRTEHLADNDGYPYMSPLAYVGGGAVMGGLLGAAGSFIHGRDPFSGAAEGAMSGVMGGAFLNQVRTSSRRSLRSARDEYAAAVAANREEDIMQELLSNRISALEFQQQQQTSVAQARSSASITGGYPSLDVTSEEGNLRARPRSSFRVVSEQNRDGTTTTMVMGGTSTTRIRRSQRGSPQGMNDPMLSLLLHSYLEQRGNRHNNARAADVDGMSYEELLVAFGDGTENMGASEAQIRSLPTRLVDDPEKELPEDARQCLICLEDIGKGETRKVLPCLHGFHSSCCDKWLRTNGSCPICKHRIR